MLLSGFVGFRLGMSPATNRGSEQQRAVGGEERGGRAPVGHPLEIRRMSERGSRAERGESREGGGARLRVRSRASGDGGGVMVRHRVGVLGVSMPSRRQRTHHVSCVLHLPTSHFLLTSLFVVGVLPVDMPCARQLRGVMPLVGVQRPQVLGVQVLPVLLGMERHVESHGERGGARGRPEGQRENRRQRARQRMHGADYPREEGTGQPRRVGPGEARGTAGARNLARRPGGPGRQPCCPTGCSRW